MRYLIKSFVMTLVVIASFLILVLPLATTLYFFIELWWIHIVAVIIGLVLMFTFIQFIVELNSDFLP